MKIHNKLIKSTTVTEKADLWGNFIITILTRTGLHKYSSALQSSQCALEIRRKLFGEEHSSTADSYHTLGITQHKLGDFSSSLQSAARVQLDIRRKLFREEHSSTTDSYYSLGITQHAHGDFSSALQSEELALDMKRQLLEKSTQAQLTVTIHSVTQHAQGDFSSALLSAQLALDIRRQLFGEEHLSTADSFHSLSDTQHAQGDFCSEIFSLHSAHWISGVNCLERNTQAQLTVTIHSGSHNIN